METKQYVYILKCMDDTRYVGCTKNLEERLKRHKASQVKSTSHRVPATLETYIVFSNKYTAFAFEKYLKSGSGRAFLNKRLIDLQPLENAPENLSKKI